MQYIKKQIPVEAVQIPMHRPSAREHLEWNKTAPAWIHNFNVWMSEEGFIIPTLEGDMLCRWGNWIIHGTHNEIYPIDNEIFLETYEPYEG